MIVCISQSWIHSTLDLRCGCTCPHCSTQRKSLTALEEFMKMQDFGPGNL